MIRKYPIDKNPISPVMALPDASRNLKMCKNNNYHNQSSGNFKFHGNALSWSLWEKLMLLDGGAEEIGILRNGEILCI